MNALKLQDLWSPRRTSPRLLQSASQRQSPFQIESASFQKVAPLRRSIRQRVVHGRNWWLAALITTVSLPAFAQPPASDTTAAQRVAMQKLNFLVGQWSGPAIISTGPGEPLHLTQTESVQYKLDGLVLLIEGAGHTAEGKTVFRALATVSFDDATNTYHFRAYNDGHYVDTALAVQKDGFSWGFDAGPARITNSMRLTDSGEWAETTDVTVGNNKPRRSVEMLLKRQP
jgi:hypothetical protein